MPCKLQRRQSGSRSTRALHVQVLAGIAVGIALGYISPSVGISMKPLGDAFIKMIKMVIGLVIFCTVVAGMGSMSDMKKMGRLGGKALLYFEVISTAALAIGMIIGNLVQPGSGFNADPSKLDATAVTRYAGQARSMARSTSCSTSSQTPLSKR